VELQQDIRPGISVVVKMLEHSDQYVRRAAIDCLSSLGAQGTYSLVHLVPFALLRLLLSELAAGDSASNLCGDEIAGAFQQGYSPNCH
jgi:vesicle coat complex subunit